MIELLFFQSNLQKLWLTYHGLSALPGAVFNR